MCNCQHILPLYRSFYRLITVYSWQIQSMKLRATPIITSIIPLILSTDYRPNVYSNLQSPTISHPTFHYTAHSIDWFQERMAHNPLLLSIIPLILSTDYEFQDPYDRIGHRSLYAKGCSPSIIPLILSTDCRTHNPTTVTFHYTAHSIDWLLATIVQRKAAHGALSSLPLLLSIIPLILSTDSDNRQLYSLVHLSAPSIIPLILSTDSSYTGEAIDITP